MAYRHGVYKSEVPTGLVPPAPGATGLPVIVGTAPIFLGSDEESLKNVNQPQLIHSYADAVALFGYSDDWEKYTLCEFIYSQFALYAMSPCVLINVFDPVKHKETVAPALYSIKESAVNLGQDVILANGVTFDTGVSYVAGTDYSVGYETACHAIFTALEGGALDGATNVKIGFTRAMPDRVTAPDIIGGVNATTGDYEGLELIDSVFPKFGLIPGLLAAPKWSEKPGVAAVMVAKMENINGLFTGQAVIDIPSSSDGADRYTEVSEWKNENNYTATRAIVCWPKIKLDDKVFHLSTQLIGLMNKTDAGNSDVPYESPSNKSLQMNACVNEDGKEISLGLDQANYLNGQGIVTALNFMGGWKAWGSHTGCYPTNTDPKDCRIPIRRMFDWIGNEFITTFWQKVDKPITPRLVKTIVNSYNVRLNGLAAREFILGGRIEFLQSENPTTDLMDGIIRFHIYVTPPSEARLIEGILEFDPAYFDTLFEAVA